MTESFPAAPLWRRFAAAVYDSLLLLGLWMATLLLTLPLQKALSLTPGNAVLRGLLFGVALVFFGWFWTRGGQTLGMRAWRLRVQRRDGAAIRWPVALVRAAALLVYATLALTPLAVNTLNHYPKVAASFPHALPAALIASSLIVLSLALRLLDSHRGLPPDWVAGTEVVALPKPAASPAPSAP